MKPNLSFKIHYFFQSIVGLSVQQQKGGFDPSKMGGDMMKQFMEKFTELTKGLSSTCGQEIMQIIGKFTQGFGGGNGKK